MNARDPRSASHRRPQNRPRTLLARQFALPDWQPAFWLAAGFLLLTFTFGGSARGDAAGVILLRPAGLVFLGLGLARLRASHVQPLRWIMIVALGVVALVALQLVPLPPALVSAMPGRSIVSEVDAVAGLGAPWRPLSLAPTQTRNTLWSLAVPLAMLILTAQLDREGRRRMAGLLLLIGAASIVLATIQTFGDPYGPAYLYADTNNGSPVGLFANRNHQAVFVATLAPIAAAWADSGADFGPKRGVGSGTRFWLALALIVAMIPVILVTGSRAGLIAGVFALVSLPWVISKRTLIQLTRPMFGIAESIWRWLVGLGAAGMVGGLVAAGVLNNRAEAINRLAGSMTDIDLRARVLPAILGLARQYLPTGAGFGAFKPVYRAQEPDAVLAPEIMNHAHNDWLESLVLGGVPAALLLLACISIWLRAAWRARAFGGPHSVETRMGRAGLVVIAILAIASLVDYPLRVPSMGCIFVLAAVWASNAVPRRDQAMVVGHT